MSMKRLLLKTVTCCRRITSAFFNILMAQKDPVPYGQQSKQIKNHTY